MVGKARVWLGIVIAVVLVANVGLLYLHAPAHVVSVNRAVERYRAATQQRQPSETTAATALAAVADSAPAKQSAIPARSPIGPRADAHTYPAPKNGVYTYNTSGFEKTDAVGGARHDYPAQTAITVSAQDCGWVQHSQPREERWHDVDVCAQGGAWLLTGVKTFHEFFRQTQEQDSTCDPGAVYLPQPPIAGATSSFACRGSFGAMNFVAQVVGTENVAVGASPVSGLRVHYAVEFTGSNRGSGTYDEWTAPNGALLQRTWDMHIVTDSPFGTVHYDEHYTITLTAMDPQT